jgi:hypothetical protein
VPRGYVRKDVALDEDQKVVPVRLHNLCRCLHYFYQIFDVPWEWEERWTHKMSVLSNLDTTSKEG